MMIQVFKGKWLTWEEFQHFIYHYNPRTKRTGHWGFHFMVDELGRLDYLIDDGRSVGNIKPENVYRYLDFSSIDGGEDITKKTKEGDSWLEWDTEQTEWIFHEYRKVIE